MLSIHAEEYLNPISTQEAVVNVEDAPHITHPCSSCFSSFTPSRAILVLQAALFLRNRIKRMFATKFLDYYVYRVFHTCLLFFWVFRTAFTGAYDCKSAGHFDLYIPPRQVFFSTIYRFVGKYFVCFQVITWMNEWHKKSHSQRATLQMIPWIILCVGFYGTFSLTLFQS